MTFEQTIVVALLSGGVAGGLVSGVINLVSEALTRRHERRTRVRAERREIYLGTIQLVAESRGQFDALIIQGPEAAPLRIRSDQMNGLIQQLTAFGSPKVLEMVHELIRTMLMLAFSVQQHTEARSQQAGAEVVSELWSRVQTLRTECVDLATRIERAINKELTA
jgi:hypothetical protein